jgi:outer membrane receptor protein involved in Fe transport
MTYSLKSFGIHLLSVFAVIAMLASLGAAQTAATGAIAGTITDSAGAVVTDANVTATDVRTGEVRTATSSGAGAYVVPLLRPGVYRLAVVKQGFKRAELTDITVHITETVTSNVQLAVGAQNETVQVNENGELLQTQDSALGNVVDQRQVESLPLVTRNYQQILGLSAGVSAEIFNAGALGRGGVDDNLVTDGTSSSDNNFQMNGVEVNDLQGSGHFSGGVATPNPDTIQEFKVQTGQYDASFGRDAGANVNVLTKSGSNSWHGDAWEFFRNEAMNANEYFRKGTGQPRGRLRQNQFGFTAGGPLVKDKLLFFTSYQGTRQQNGIDQNCSSSVVLPLLTSDRSAKALAASVGPDTAFGGYDPNGILVDETNVSPQAVALFNAKLNGQYLIPNPQTIRTDPQTGKPEGFSTFSTPCPYYEDQFMVNVDWLQSSKSTFQERFFWSNTDGTFTISPAVVTAGSLPGSPIDNPGDFRNFSLAHNYIFTPHLVNQAEIGFHRTLAGTGQAFPVSYSQLGSSVPAFDDNRAVLAVLGGLNIGGNGQSTIVGQNTYILQDTLSWARGNHSLRFGGSVTHARDNLSNFGYGAYSIFLNYPSIMIGAGPYDPVETIDLAGITARNYRLWDGSLYVQDDWKLTSKFTLNLGLRYERLGDIYEANGRNANIDPSKLNPNPPPTGSLEGLTVAESYHGPMPAGVTRSPNDFGIRGDGQNSWQPRVGFAWTLPGSDRFVLRGGYGIYNQRATAQPYFQQETNQPFTQYRVTVGTAGWAAPIPPDPGAFPQFAPYMLGTLYTPVILSQTLRPPKFEHYSMNLQAEITPNTVLQVGYSGMHGTDMLVLRNIDQGGVASASNPIRGQTDNLLENWFFRVPYEGFGYILEIGNTGFSWYNALQASVEHRFSHGLQFLASYTYSKDLTNTYEATIDPNGGVQVGDNSTTAGAYGPDSFVRPHRFVMTYVYDIPGFKNSNAFARNVLSGWRISGVTTLQSGHLLPIIDYNATNVYTFGFTQDFAQLKPGCNLASSSGSITVRAANAWFNTSCVTTEPLVGDGTGFGNSGLGAFKGPAQANSDVSLIKLFPTGWPNERANVEFRVEAFNIFNQVNFADPNNVNASAGFGQISTTIASPRILQLGLKFNF